MKKITEIEEAMRADKVSELGISHTFYWAYIYAKDRENKYIDFNDMVWRKEVDAVMADLKRYGIKTFTVSDASKSLNETLASFCDRGCKLVKMVKINGGKTFTDNFEEEFQVLNAIQLKMPR